MKSDEAIRNAKEIWSSMGKVNAPVTAKVSGQEIIVNPGYSSQQPADGLYKNGKDKFEASFMDPTGPFGDGSGSAAIVPKGKPGEDDQAGAIDLADGILGGKIDWETGQPFYKDPRSIMAAKGAYTADNILNKLLKKYLTYHPGTIGLNTMKIQYAQLKPIKKNFMDWLNRKLEDQTNLNQIEEVTNSIPDQYDGLMAAAGGKESCKLPGYNGKDNVKNPINGLGNNILGILGSIIGFGQLLNAKRQRLSKPNFYRANPTASTALNGLASLSYDDNLIINDYRDASRSSKYRLMNQGGLSAGLKYIGAIASDLANARQIADFRANAQQYNNLLRSAYYNALQQYGTAELQQRMAAAQTNYNAYTAAHNAREQQMQMGLYNILSQGQQWYKNDQTRRMYNRTYNLYNQQLDNDAMRILAQYDPDEYRRRYDSR